LHKKEEERFKQIFFMRSLHNMNIVMANAEKLLFCRIAEMEAYKRTRRAKAMDGLSKSRESKTPAF
jgi:hypothetical protein